MILQINNLYKSFNNLEVLRGINLNVNKGEVISILGSSGSGKSTLLRCINLLENLDRGEIIFEDKNIYSCNENLIRKEIGMVFQSFNLFDNLSVLKNCVLAQRKVLKRSKEEAEEIAINNLKLVGLSDFINYDPKKLSGGQKQRVAIARCLSMNPKIILFDEPTSALDPELVGEVLEVIKDLAKRGITMIIVTHEIKFALEVSSRIVFMDKGIIIEDNSPIQIVNNPQNERTKEFLKRYQKEQSTEM